MDQCFGVILFSSSLISLHWAVSHFWLGNIARHFEANDLLLGGIFMFLIG
jgi:hypothetical protein